MKRFFFVILILITGLFIFLSLTDTSYLHFTIENRFNLPSQRYIDDTDFTVYFQRTSWVAGRLVPYRDVLEEYPQWGLLYLSLPRLVADSYQAYRTGLIILNALSYFALGWLVYRLLTRWHRQRYIFWLLLPSFVFFTFSRFDIFVALLVVLSLYLLFENKISWSFFCLGLSVLTKWYPLIFLPIYFLYLWRTEQLNRQTLIQPLIFFLVPILGPLLVTLFGAGWSATLYPYFFHLGRGPEAFSLLTFLAPGAFLVGLFFYLQLSGLLVLFFSRLKTQSDVLLLMSLALLLFIFFNRIYSPQFIVWLLPLLILVLSQRELLLVGLYDLLNYLGYVKLIPAVWDDYGLPFWFNLFRIIVLVIIIYLVARRIKVNQFLRLHKTSGYG